MQMNRRLSTSYVNSIPISRTMTRFDLFQPECGINYARALKEGCRARGKKAENEGNASMERTKRAEFQAKTGKKRPEKEIKRHKELNIKKRRTNTGRNARQRLEGAKRAAQRVETRQRERERENALFQKENTTHSGRRKYSNTYREQFL